MRKYILPVVALLLIGGGGGYWYLTSTATAKVTYRTEPVTRGELVATISATGTLEPEEVIDVGAQVAGLIKEFGVGADGKPIDYGSPVEAGTVLARIEDSLYKARADQARAAIRSAEQQVAQAKAKLEQAKAAVEQARANTQRAEADLLQARAKADQTDREWVRAQSLRATGSLSQQEYDAAKSAADANRAAVAVAEAALGQAKAGETNARAAVPDAEAAVGVADAAVTSAKAALQQDEINLGYTTIKSPVKGTILDRRVTLGQTVQSSFNTPSLFLIAKDLRRMTVWASVNEADVSQVWPGQPVRFTVDAHPNEVFTGTVGRVRLNATNTQNVVVYTVEVQTDNTDGKLLPPPTVKPEAPPADAPANPEKAKGKARPKRDLGVGGKLIPYLTANLRFEVDRRSDALLVPNSALRYKPANQPAAAGAKGGKGPEKERTGHGTVWVEEDGKIRPVSVELGLTDGNMTEVTAGDLQPEAAVVVGELRTGAAPSSDAANPFAPKMGGGKKQQ